MGKLGNEEMGIAVADSQIVVGKRKKPGMCWAVN